MPHVLRLRLRALARHPTDRDLTGPPVVTLGAMGRVAPPRRAISHPASSEHLFKAAQRLASNSKQAVGNGFVDADVICSLAAGWLAAEAR